MLNINKIKFPIKYTLRIRGDYMNEIWKSVKDWEDKYEISNFGNVRNKNMQKYLTGDINNFGYYRVALYDNGESKRHFRHRLVASHFIENPNPVDFKFVNHIDGDKSNNKYTNLEWCDQSHNEKHAFATGLKRKTNEPFIAIFDDGRIGYYDYQYELANEIGVSQTAVSAWLNKKATPKNKVIKEILFC